MNEKTPSGEVEERRIVRDGIAETAMSVVRKAIAHHDLMVSTHQSFLESLKKSLREMEVYQRDLRELETKIEESVIRRSIAR